MSRCVLGVSRATGDVGGREGRREGAQKRKDATLRVDCRREANEMARGRGREGARVGQVGRSGRFVRMEGRGQVGEVEQCGCQGGCG